MYTLVGLWPPHPGLARFRLVWTDRHGGVSSGPYGSLNLSLTVGDERRSVIVNRQRLAAALGISAASCVWCEQNGQAKVREVAAADFGRGLTDPAEALADCDGMVATAAAAGLESKALFLLGADDLMLALVDPEAGIGGVFHFGCRELLAGLPDRAVEALVKAGAQMARIRGFASPHACAERLEVHEDVRKECIQKYGMWVEMLFRQTGPRKFLFDLQGLLVARLTAAGMPQANLQTSLECTISRTDLLFSETYARKAGHSTGRQGLLLILDPA
ncbi:MAG TPA: polyphenol oxidase family protein [Planctomycetota bacterium]|nr:polyphenol oxidase family protein [Planctomycetota bacterium]